MELLLSVRESRFVDFLEAMLSQLINLRYLSITLQSLWGGNSHLFPSTLYLLWNLQTLIVNSSHKFIAPPEIWKMTQLRHIKFSWSLKLPDPPSGFTEGRDDIVLGNLHTLMTVNNFKCGEEVVKRIPHIKKLHVEYDGIEGWSLSCFNNLDLLKLESLHCIFSSINGPNWSDVLKNLTFPHSLRRLTLRGCHLHWEDITTKIGILPLLEVLKLQNESTRDPKWETVEGGFPNLKFLKIMYSYGLECWTVTDSTHFPVLEHLVLMGLPLLRSVPSELGNVPTLKLIELHGCFCAHKAAEKILEEQLLEYGNSDLQVQVEDWEEFWEE